MDSRVLLSHFFSGFLIIRVYVFLSECDFYIFKCLEVIKNEWLDILKIIMQQ
jgi:hypothetical protein